MIEDDIYRTSTQYRLWSFTEESLRSIRTNTNTLASQRVRVAIRRAKEARQSNAATADPGDADARGADAKNGEQVDREIECLTPAEELELVRYYCEKTMELGDEYKPPLPTMVRATAIQYLRRFYLTNSPMTYHPKSIMPCALFLATKTDNYYMSLRSFTEKIPNVSTEDIIAPEFLLTQGLRFTFDVRHPFRGLEGGIMELNAIAQGEGVPGPRCLTQTTEELQNALQLITPLSSSAGQDSNPVSITSRISKAHHNAREILKSAALMTDVYFLYTPSQIWLAALLLADRPLAEFYIDAKLGPSLSPSPANSEPPSLDVFATLHAKLTTVLTSCSSTLNAYLLTQQSPPDPASMKNLKRIGKKLYHCQNPEKMDLVSLNRAQKREGSSATSASLSASTSSVPAAAGDSGIPQTSEEAELQRVAKKRRLEREKFAREGASIFGGSLMDERRRRIETGERGVGDGGGGQRES